MYFCRGEDTVQFDNSHSADTLRNEVFQYCKKLYFSERSVVTVYSVCANKQDLGRLPAYRLRFVASLCIRFRSGWAAGLFI